MTISKSILQLFLLERISEIFLIIGFTSSYIVNNISYAHALFQIPTKFKKKRKSKVDKEKITQKQEVPHLKKRVDKIKKLEDKAQQLWEKEKIFEVDAPKVGTQDLDSLIVFRVCHIASLILRPGILRTGTLIIEHDFNVILAIISLEHFMIWTRNFHQKIDQLFLTAN